MLAFGIVTGILVLGALFLDEGDVVTLITHSEEREYFSHVWIVEIDGRRYLRANRPEARWLRRLRENSAVGLREGRGLHLPVKNYRAQIVRDPELRLRVDAAMAEKYGQADEIWGRIVERSNSVPIELLPAPAMTSGKRNSS